MSLDRHPSDDDARSANSTTWHAYDWERREEVSRLLERERVLNEALHGPLPPGLDLPAEAHVLHVACGPGTWLYLLSLTYPSLRLTGIEKSPYYVQCARHYLAGLDTVTLQVHDLATECDVLPTGKFDLVHLRFLAAELPLEVLSEAVAELVISCQHGACVYWTECLFPSTNSAACEQLGSCLQQGLQRQPRGCVLGGSNASVRAYMAYALHRAGCRVVQDQQHVLDISAGMPAHHAFVQQARVLIEQLRPLVVEAGVLGGQVYDALAMQALEQMREAQFCGVLFLHSMLAVAP